MTKRIHMVGTKEEQKNDENDEEKNTTMVSELSYFFRH